MGTPNGAAKCAARHHGLSLEDYQAKLSAGLKWCSSCRAWVDRDTFSRDASRSDGLSTRCKPCEKAKYKRFRPRQRELEAQNRAGINERMRCWRSDPTNAAKQRACSRRYRKKNLERCRDQERRYYQENRERCKETSRACRLKRYEQYLVRRLASRAAKRRIPFDLEPSDIIIPKLCPVLGIPITKEGRGQRDGAPSVDRLVPERGYVKGNIKIISMRANQIKNCASIEEVEKVLAYMKEHISR